MQSAAHSVTSTPSFRTSTAALVRVLWILVGAIVGLVFGALAGFGAALATMGFDPRWDGTYGMREMIVGPPCGALVGLVAGVVWGRRPA